MSYKETPTEIFESGNFNTETHCIAAGFHKQMNGLMDYGAIR